MWPKKQKGSALLSSSPAPKVKKMFRHSFLYEFKKSIVVILTSA
jgi:hypothetical protein